MLTIQRVFHSPADASRHCFTDVAQLQPICPCAPTFLVATVRWDFGILDHGGIAIRPVNFATQSLYVCVSQHVVGVAPTLD